MDHGATFVYGSEENEDILHIPDEYKLENMCAVTTPRRFVKY